MAAIQGPELTVPDEREQDVRPPDDNAGGFPPVQPEWPDGTIFTLGHSTLAIDDFLGVLEIYEIAHLVDIRTLPRSRYNPQFNGDALAASCRTAGIAYTHMQALGGMRKARDDSRNTGFRDGGFRGYADYMETEAFQHALDDLIRLGRESRTAIMCAEAVPWQCHRSLVSDALTIRNIPVIAILPAGENRRHTLTPFARVEGMRLVYPPEQPSLF